MSVSPSASNPPRRAKSPLQLHLRELRERPQLRRSHDDPDHWDHWHGERDSGCLRSRLVGDSLAPPPGTWTPGPPPPGEWRPASDRSRSPPERGASDWGDSGLREDLRAPVPREEELRRSLEIRQRHHRQRAERSPLQSPTPAHSTLEPHRRPPRQELLRRTEEHHRRPPRQELLRRTEELRERLRQSALFKMKESAKVQERLDRDGEDDSDDDDDEEENEEEDDEDDTGSCEASDSGGESQAAAPVRIAGVSAPKELVHLDCEGINNVVQVADASSSSGSEESSSDDCEEAVPHDPYAFSSIEACDDNVEKDALALESVVATNTSAPMGVSVPVEADPPAPSEMAPDNVREQDRASIKNPNGDLMTDSYCVAELSPEKSETHRSGAVADHSTGLAADAANPSIVTPVAFSKGGGDEDVDREIEAVREDDYGAFEADEVFSYHEDAEEEAAEVSDPDGCSTPSGANMSPSPADDSNGQQPNAAESESCPPVSGVADGANTAAPAGSTRVAAIQDGALEGVASRPVKDNVVTTSVTDLTGDSAPSASSVSQSLRNVAKRAKTSKDESNFMLKWQSLLERTRRHPQYALEYTKLFTGEGKSWRRPTATVTKRLVLGLDCEMVYAKGDANALARVSVVSVAKPLLDIHVRRPEPDDVLDYRSVISGVEPEHLLERNGAVSFEVAQDKVLELISPDTILVGHALQNDLRALRIYHTKVVDTALLFTVEGGNNWRKHKLHSLVQLMRPKVATLQSVVLEKAHDSRQDAEWALQLALYEASIHPRQTKALRLEAFPTKVFLTEIPKGASMGELRAIFPGGVVSDVTYHLEEPGTVWLGHAIVTYLSQAERDTAYRALAHYVCIHVGPLRSWANRKDIAKMGAELLKHFSRFGGVHGCRAFRPRSSNEQRLTFPVAQLDCHPATARALLTNSEARFFAQHRLPFELQLAKDDPFTRRRAVIPLGTGSFVAKIQ